MPDIVDSETRSRMMSGIRGKNTKPELMVRKALHARGIRYRLHSPKVPGKPDLVFPKWKAVVFVNGCFWHGHGCHLCKLPKTRTAFWKEKITRNRERDVSVRGVLKQSGWRVLTVWECSLRGRHKLVFDDLIDSTALWLASEFDCSEIQGAA